MKSNNRISKQKKCLKERSATYQDQDYQWWKPLSEEELKNEKRRLIKAVALCIAIVMGCAAAAILYFIHN